MLASIFEKGGTAVGKIGKIRPEQLRTAQKILRELTVKDTRCSREEAAAFLEKDFKRAFRKGYTPKELCALMKKAGLIIPEHLIVQSQEPVGKLGVNKDRESGKQGSRAERNSIVTSQKNGNDEVAKDLTPSGEVQGAPMTKPVPERYGTFPIIPDSPIGEL